MDCVAAAARSLRRSAHRARIPPAAWLAPELRPRRCAAILSRHLNVQTTTETTRRLKTIDDLPGPSLATSLYMMFGKGLDQRHLLQGKQKNIYGPIWRSKFGPYDLVNVACPELIAQVSRQEGRYPVRAELPQWKEYRDMRGQAYGLHVSTGEEWYQIRSVLNPKMLKLREVKAFAPVIHQVVADLLRRIEFLRSLSEDQVTVSDLAAELYKFGFEAVSLILFETRLGCLQEEIPQDTLNFIAAVNDMLMLTDVVVLLPHWSRSILPYWKRFVQAWDDLYGVAQSLVDRRVSEIAAQLSRGEPADGMYLAYLLSSDKLTRDEVYITITEMLLGGVDTTSNTLSWALYHLARDERVQDHLYREVSSVCPDRRDPAADDLNSMPYLKAVIKETLRLYPVVPGNGRLISEDAVVVGNYWFPKKTMFHLCHYAVSHDEAQFPDAERFIPERWLRGKSEQETSRYLQHHPFSSIPFGVGVRACVGRRVAEMEMYFVVSKLLQHYKIQPDAGAATVKPKTRILLVPEKPINLRFVPRVQ